MINSYQVELASKQISQTNLNEHKQAYPYKGAINQFALLGTRPWQYMFVCVSVPGHLLEVHTDRIEH